MEPPAQQEPSHIPIPTPRQVRAAAAEAAQSNRAADTVLERILEAPVVVTQRELRAIAPDAWAQAASESKRTCEEQPLFMMLKDILGNAYKPDVSRMTARSARLAQITNDYTAAALARSQPDAPPPHIPFCSNTSQSDQSPPKLHQSVQAHPLPDTERSRPASSAKYEHISLSKVGARPICPSSNTNIHQDKPPLPEQQADEPRFALQSVATKPSHRRESESSPPPIHPVQPSVATEATPSSVVAIETPPSPLAAAQQQPALSSPRSVPFTPFHSLSTTYRIPASSPIKANIPDFSCQPPSIATEVTPPPVIAEAPPSPIVALQQRSAPPSFHPLRFKPFSSLLTSYRIPTSLSSPVYVPDLRRQSPPQLHQPPRKPSPVDTAVPAHSATPTETVLVQALSPAADPEGSEERANQSTEEPEEPE